VQREDALKHPLKQTLAAGKMLFNLEVQKPFLQFD
jgi:hypothetical protein